MSKSNRKIHAVAQAAPVTKTPGATTQPPAPNGSPWQVLISYNPAKPNDPEMKMLDNDVSINDVLNVFQQLRDAMIETRYRAVLDEQAKRQAAQATPSGDAKP